jgi:gamma-glutamylcyclotransferase (GGCT)/AIG2-like uncharacterized protein YtfP
MTETQEAYHLFSYGTLQTPTVQVATFGRRLQGKPDALVGYRLVMIQVGDHDFVKQSGTAHHRNLEYTGQPSDVVHGTVLTLTQQEFEQADAYEPEGYERVQVELRSGANAWVYLSQKKTE